MTEDIEWRSMETVPRGEPLFNVDGPVVRVLYSGGQTGEAYFGRSFGPNIGPRWNDRKGGACSTPVGWAPLEEQNPNIQTK